jgi:hypothetical protein
LRGIHAQSSHENPPAQIQTGFEPVLILEALALDHPQRARNGHEEHYTDGDHVPGPGFPTICIHFRSQAHKLPLPSEWILARLRREST